MSSSYDAVRATLHDSRNNEERVEVNQRALIDKILARYASAGAVYRELLQNSNDAEATHAEIYFTTTAAVVAARPEGSNPTGSSTTTSTTRRRSNNNNNTELVTQVLYRNNGLPFRPQDWSRLKKIAEGNPDESKIGAFGVGAYTIFSICEEPLVLSGQQALAFVWKGDSLWTKTMESPSNDPQWTCFVLKSRDPYPMPSLAEFGQFLCASLTFTKCLRTIRVYVNQPEERISNVKPVPSMTITKTQMQAPIPVQIKQSSAWYKSDGANTVSPQGLFTLKKDSKDALMESYYHFQVDLHGSGNDDRAGVSVRYLSAMAQTKLSAAITKRMERVTKKKPPAKVMVQMVLNAQQQQHQEDDDGDDDDEDQGSTKKKKKTGIAQQVIQSFLPRMGEGRIFIGFRTSQTTGLAAHLAAPFVPTVEREAMDLQDQTLRLFNLELLQFAGILMRLTLEHGMETIGVEYQKGLSKRLELEERLLKEQREKERYKKHSPTSSEPGEDGTPMGDAMALESQPSGDASNKQDKNNSALWGFAKFMAKGVKKTLVKVVNTVEDIVDDGGELIRPRDPLPLCAEEHQAILLMQSFCPRQSTPDPLVGIALAEGFARCMPDSTPPALTRSGVITGGLARLPYKGMEAFCKDNVVRSVVYLNAQEYYDVIAGCRPLVLKDLQMFLSKQVLDENMMIRFFKWWVRFNKIKSNISPELGLALKDSIRFELEGHDKKATSKTVVRLSDFLFFLDPNRIRTSGETQLESLPMPDTVLPRHIQESVTTRILSDWSLKAWFEPIPLELWIDFVSGHAAMTAGGSEHHDLRFQVLYAMNQEYSSIRNARDRAQFGTFCANVVKGKPCVPVDGPRGFTTDLPSNVYLASAQLDAFSGIGTFRKVSSCLQKGGIGDDFLLAIGVRKSVAIDFLFSNLEVLKWSSDPKPLVEYLRTATLTNADMEKLKNTRYLPSESGSGELYAPSELYLPDKELRILPFVRLLQWPSKDGISARSPDGKFLTSLGMQRLPSLVKVLEVVIKANNPETRILYLDFVAKRLGPGGDYQHAYSGIGRSQRSRLKILPCRATDPIDNQETQLTCSPVQCFIDSRCGILGFPVLDSSLGDKRKLFGNLFQCPGEPEPMAMTDQLLLLVTKAKANVKRSGSSPETTTTVQQVLLQMFEYLSTKVPEFNRSLLGRLGKENFIPCLAKGRIDWSYPNQVFFKSSVPGDTVTETLFQSIEYSAFLAAVGVRQEPSTRDIFRLMLEDPLTVFAAAGSEEKYKLLLRRIAAHRPFSNVSKEIKEAPFLLSYSNAGDGPRDSSKCELARAEEIFIIDNSFFGRMFTVNRAPHESDLEDFYALVGSKYISNEVQKRYDVIGTASTATELTEAVAARIKERSPLLVSPSVTSRPLVKDAASKLNARSLDIKEVATIKAVYSLEKSVRSQKTTCCAKALGRGKNILYVTSDFDWFDVGYAVGDLILQRCQLEDAFFISSILEAPLEQLKDRGFPVERIIETLHAEEAERIAKIEAEEAKRVAKREADEAKRAEQVAKAEATNLTTTGSKNDQPVVNPPIAASIPLESMNQEERNRDNVDQQTEKEDIPALMDDDKSPDLLSTVREMFPNVDEDTIRQRLGEEPTQEMINSLVDEMASAAATASESQSAAPHENESLQNYNTSKKSKLLGSKKLGRALNSIRGQTNLRNKDPLPAEIPAPVSVAGKRGNDPVPSAVDAASHQNMEDMLKQVARQSSTVNANGVSAPEVNFHMPQGLDQGRTCEVIPGQNLVPFRDSTNQNTGETHNGIKIFAARNFPASVDFLKKNADTVESFAVVVERLCRVFDLSVQSTAIFHDPTGGTIAFNSNRALHFNVRFYSALHHQGTTQQQSSSSAGNAHAIAACYSYWFVTFAHELAHHLATGHDQVHAQYTENYISCFLPKFLMLLAELK